MKKVSLRHLIIWLLLSIIFYLLSEPITKLLLPGVHDATIWLAVLAVGLILIFCVLTISLMTTFKKHSKTES
jgi:hypothetical protein